MEDTKRENFSSEENAPKDVLLDLLERSKEMDEDIDDHQGIIIGDRLTRLPSAAESE